jgi:23S rRNA pseudouridine1911/1915/1917 synthase
MKFEVKERSTLSAVLQFLSPDSSKNRLRSWIKQGRVSANEKPITSWNHLLQPGEVLRVGPKISFASDGIKILYEDRSLVVIDKPAKLLTVPSLDALEKSVQAILQHRLKKKAFPVHRLDKDTSGVLVMAYTENAKEHLKEQFATHSIQRVYYALVEGTPKPLKGTWKSNLVANEKSYFVKSAPSGKLAITHYEVIEERKGFCLIRCILETGRKNQIRVHASESGHPVIGDTKYGGQTRKVRLCLHAHILGFTHPTKQKNLTFTSPIPKVFSRTYF